MTWGAIEWLPDLDRWAGIIARHLEPGGTFYLAEMHPFAQILDDEAPEGVLRVRYPYFAAPDRPMVDAIDGSYADPGADTTGLFAHSWAHDFAEVLGALTAAGSAARAPARVPLLPGAVLGVDGPGRGPLVVAARRQGRAAPGPAVHATRCAPPGPRAGREG